MLIREIIKREINYNFQTIREKTMNEENVIHSKPKKKIEETTRGHGE